jgi:hypothetical protein
MLKLVATDGKPASSRPLLLNAVALVGADADLARYLIEALEIQWPQIRVNQFSEVEPDAPFDLIIRADDPPLEPHCRTLWLAEITRTPHVLRLGPNLWRAAMPLSAHEFLKSIHAVFQMKF